MGIVSSNFPGSANEMGFIKRTIEGDCVVIFSKSDCPHSLKAKKLFDDMKTKYSVVELDKRSDGEKLQEKLGELTGSATVPRVFINGEFVGGATETQKLRCSGKLENLVSQCKLRPQRPAVPAGLEPTPSSTLPHGDCDCPFV